MATSYANLGGTGNRIGVVGIQANAGLLITDGPAYLINGSFSNENYFAGAAASGQYLLFDFGTAVLIDEALWYQDNSTANGTWKWQGSNDNSSFTDIGSSFTLGGTTTQTHTQINGNSTSYRYYRLLGVSGSTSTGPYTREIEFKIDGMTDPTPGTSYANTGGTGDRRSIITMTNSGIIIGSSPYTNWIDGSTSENDDYFTGGALSGSVYVRWDLGTAKVINQMRFYQQTAALQGVWKVQGSNDASAWTDIGHQFELGLTALQYITAPSGNTTGYRYYQIVGVSGNTNSGPYVREFEFKIGDPAGGTAYTLTAAQGSFAESGQTAVLSYGRKLISAVGSLALSGQNALFPVARKVTAAQGSFSLTGQTANLNAGKTITAAQGSFILTGQAAGLASARTMTAANGSFALNGQTAALLKGKTITGDVGSFALTGQSSALTSARRLAASQGSFALSGQTAALIQARLMQAANGSFTLTGQAAAMRRALRMQAAYGSFVFTGQSATLTGPSSDAVVLTHPLSFTIRSGRTYVDIASGKTEIEVESGRKTIDIG